MARGFFFKLGLTNLNRNRRMIFPYFISATVMVSVHFLTMMILHSRSIGNLEYGATIQQLFRFGTIIMTGLILAFMLYINSFLIKGRKKEFGLYGILGLEKRHVGRVILWENLVLSGLTLLLGIIAGSVFGRLVFLLLLYAFRVAAAGTSFVLPWEAYVYTAAVFAISFVLTTVFNLLHVSLVNPIDLLKGGQMGEKRVRFVVPLTVTGLGMLAWAYYTALTVTNPIAAINQFFIAVGLVIGATTLLFTTGSVFILNVLKKNKGLYYKSRNFVAISSMFHRMKQNAAGLASICILSTMVLVTVAGTCSLFIGQESMLTDMYPDDVRVTLGHAISGQQLDEMNSLIASLERQHGVTVEGRYSYAFGSTVQLLKDGVFSRPDFGSGKTNLLEVIDYLVGLTIIPLADYNEHSPDQVVLSNNELIFLGVDDLRIPEVFQAGENQYRVKAIVSDSFFSTGRDSFGASIGVIFVVTAGEAAALQLLNDLESGESNLQRAVFFNLTGKDDNSLAFVKGLRGGLTGIDNVSQVSDIYTERIDGYGIFGGLLFLGAFFTVLFLSATILIIYFKQISEGYDDKDRFEILQKVGMDDQEVKATINTQIRTIFFLPLVAAYLHILAASPMIVKILQVFNLFNATLTAICITATCIVFAVVYLVVFKLTAKTYYGIVRR